MAKTRQRSELPTIRPEPTIRSAKSTILWPFYEVEMRFVTPLLLIFLLQSQNISKPHIAPFFDRIDDGPAFFVDCLNTGNDKVSSTSSEWP
jgi:hypothetical protein